MRIVDVHVHIYDQFRGMTGGEPVVSDRYGKVRIGNRIAQFLPPSFETSASTTEMLIAHIDAYQVERALVLQNVLYGYHNQYCLDAVQRFPGRLKALALVNVMRGKEAAAELSALVGQGFSGLKIEVDSAFQCRPDMELDDTLFDPIWSVCHEAGLMVSIHAARPENIQSMRRLAARYSGIQFILCHFGAEAALSAWPNEDLFNGLLDIVKASSQIYLDTSSIPYNLKDLRYPFAESCRLVEKAYARVGPEKILWATDYPGMLTMATYKQLTEMLPLGCPNIPAPHMDMIMGENAVRLIWNGR